MSTQGPPQIDTPTRVSGRVGGKSRIACHTIALPKPTPHEFVWSHASTHTSVVPSSRWVRLPSLLTTNVFFSSPSHNVACHNDFGSASVWSWAFFLTRWTWKGRSRQGSTFEVYKGHSNRTSFKKWRIRVHFSTFSAILNLSPESCCIV